MDTLFRARAVFANLKMLLSRRVHAVVGTTGFTADDLAACIAVAKAHGLPTHVDAAWAGSAMIAPEFRRLWAGVDQADSVGTILDWDEYFLNFELAVTRDGAERGGTRACPGASMANNGVPQGLD